MKYAVFAGLNNIDPNYYGNNGQLKGCINDVSVIKDLFRPDDSVTLLNSEATVGNFASIVKLYASLAVAGDTVLINYSGHGTQLPSSVNLEKDNLDEGFCFYDRILIDKDFNNLVAEFKEGVKVIGFLDCCFSGGVSRIVKIPKEHTEYRPKTLELSYSNKKIINLRPLQCSYIGLLACLETQVALDGKENGLFTQTMLAEYKADQDLLTWLSKGKKKVTAQTFTYKLYGRKKEWKKELF